MHSGFAHEITPIKYVYTPAYEVDIGPHVFPTTKYRLVRDRLLREGVASEEDFLLPALATPDELKLVHTHAFLEDLQALRPTHRTLRSELPLTEEIAQAYILAAGGTILACRTALESPGRMCCHIGGGFHHAFADHAEGFCYINDIAVAVRVMQKEGRVSRAMVIDCDLHQGNGTAHIFHGDPSVFTFSIHQENNYPMKQQSDLDIGLDDGTGDAEYLAELNRAVPSMLESHNPGLLVYVAGADPYEDDQLGGLTLTLDGLKERDRIVLDSAAKAGVPAVTVTAGGYARQLADTVTIHTQTCKVAKEIAGR